MTANPTYGQQSWHTQLNTVLDEKVPKSNATPTKALYLGALNPANGTTIAALVDGSATVPNTATNYSTPVVYIERHTNNPTATQSNNWASAYKNAAQLIEVVAGASEQGEVNGLAARVTATSGIPASGQGLVGISALAQCDAPAAVRSRDCFGANFAVVTNSGLSPINLVGIEVDIVPRVAMQWENRPLGVHSPDYNNWTGYLAQSAGTFPANTGFIAGTSNGTPGQTTPGWLYGFVGECDFAKYVGYFRNTKAGATSKGLYLETQFSGATGRVLECFIGAAQEQFRVDGDASNPVWVRRDGTLQNISVFLLQDSSALNTGQQFRFGNFRLSGDSDVVRISSAGSAGGYIVYGNAGGTGTNGGVRFYDNATDNNLRALISTSAPASGTTALQLSYHNGTSVVASTTVTVGAADSGGAGFRSLRVPN